MATTLIGFVRTLSKPFPFSSRKFHYGVVLRLPHWTSIDRLTKFLLVFSLILVVTGGVTFRGPNFRLEISQLNLFGIVVSLFCFIIVRSGHWEQSQTQQVLSKLLDRIEDLTSSHRKLFLSILVIMSWLFITRLFRHYTLNTDYMDVSCLHQPLFYPFFPKLLHCDACRAGTQLAEHITWIMVLIAPLFAWLKSDLSVFVFKSFMVGMGLYLMIAKGAIKSIPKMWGLALLIFFSSKSFRGSQVWDFREDDLAFFLLIIAIIGLSNRRMLVFWIGAIGAMICKENIPFVTLFFAPIILFRSDLPTRTRWIHALGVAFVSLVYALLVLKIFIPHFMGPYQGGNHFVLRFPGMGTTAGEVVYTMFSHPKYLWRLVVDNFLTIGAIKYLIILVAPFVAFGWSSPIWFVGALPGIAMNTLASMETQKMMIFHYDLIILPFLMAATLEGMTKLAGKKKFAVIAVLVCLCTFDRSPSAEISERWITHGYRMKAVTRLAHLDLQGPVAANRKIWAHLNHLPQLRLINFPENDGEFSESELKRLNPPRGLEANGVHPQDSRYIVLQLENAFEMGYKNSLLTQGAVLIDQWPREAPLFAVIEVKGFPY